MCPYSIQGNPIFSIKKLCVSNKISSLNRSYYSLTSIIGTRIICIILARKLEHAASYVFKNVA